MDIIVGIAVVPVDIISVAVGRNAGINTQTVPVGLDTEDVLGDIDKRSMLQCRLGQLFCFTVSRSVCAGNHLCVNVGSVGGFTDIFQISGTGFTIYLKCGGALPMTVSAMEIQDYCGRRFRHFPCTRRVGATSPSSR